MFFDNAQDRGIAVAILLFFAMLFSSIGVWVNQAQEHSEVMRDKDLRGCVALEDDDVAECVLLTIDGD